jgi:hypothetical protein
VEGRGLRRGRFTADRLRISVGSAGLLLVLAGALYAPVLVKWDRGDACLANAPISFAGSSGEGSGYSEALTVWPPGVRCSASGPNAVHRSYFAYQLPSTLKWAMLAALASAAALLSAGLVVAIRRVLPGRAGLSGG